MKMLLEISLFHVEEDQNQSILQMFIKCSRKMELLDLNILLKEPIFSSLKEQGKYHIK